VGGAITVTPIEVVWTRESFVPVTVTVCEPAPDAPRVHVDVWLSWRLAGEQDVETPGGVEASVSWTVPLKPPVEWRAIVEVAD